MQTNALIAALFATAASGAAIKRQVTSFSVTEFSASCIPHSVMCNYAFNVITNPASASPSGNNMPSECKLMLQGPDILPPVNATGCTQPSAYSWALAVKDDGLHLSVTTPQDSHGNYTGEYVITTDQLVIDQNGAVVDQRYTGPPDFEVPVGAPLA